MSLQLTLFALTVLLFVATLVGQKVAGPARWVRLATVAMLVAGAASVVAWRGLLEGLVGIVVIVLVSQFVTFVAMTTWRQPLEATLLPTDPEDCPFHARDAVTRWSQELWEKLGFEHFRDGAYEWSFAGKPKRAFTRFFRHPKEPCYVEISVLEEPKVAGRIFVSTDESGRSVMTSDRLSDSAVLGDEMTSDRQVPETATCAEMLRAHADELARSGGSWLVIDDPAATRARLRAAWLARLVAAGKLRQVGDEVAIVRSRLPRLQLAVLARWLR